MHFMDQVLVKLQIHMHAHGTTLFFRDVFQQSLSLDSLVFLTRCASRERPIVGQIS